MNLEEADYIDVLTLNSLTHLVHLEQIEMVSSKLKASPLSTYVSLFSAPGNRENNSLNQ